MERCASSISRWAGNSDLTLKTHLGFFIADVVVVDKLSASFRHLMFLVTYVPSNLCFRQFVFLATHVSSNVCCRFIADVVVDIFTIDILLH